LDGTSLDSLPLSTGSIIVATDGTEASDSAIVAGRVLAARTGAPLQIVSAVEPFAIPTFDADLATVPPEITALRRTAQRDAIHAQLQRLGQSSIEQPVMMFDGDAASVVAKAAHDRHARMLVLGRGRHGLMGRMLMGETVLRVLQLADVPVLAVEPGFAALPQRVMIAIDFSPYSVYAARVALSIIDPNATLYLTYVTPRFEELTPGLDLLAERDEAVEAALARVRGEIGAEQMQVETITLRGHLGHALVDFATSKNVDLVVSGTHGYGFFNRLILGSVAKQLVHGAPCSVLAVPGSAAIRAATREHVGGSHALDPDAGVVRQARDLQPDECEQALSDRDR
jgi:nucleotide-binding universal stress UspA family protein